MELKKKIEDEKVKLKDSTKFSPITNCSLELDGVRCNINTLQRQGLIELLIKLNIFKLSAEDLNLLQEYKLSGFLVTEWIDDVKSKLNIVSRKLEEANLKIMEDKLTKMLSDEKKTELELNEIAELLK